MSVVHLPADRVFFEEWSRLRGASTRSVPRAARFAEKMGVALQELPAIVVVGSKGKATAATYASAALAAAGHRVGTITSPPILTNRERIRVNGVAIDESEYEALAGRVEEALRGLSESDGYLSPAGLYMIAGIDHFLRAGCDAIVVEAGMGGKSDEVSLLDPVVLAVTPIFLEHAGILGDTVEEITEEKLGAAGPQTTIIRATGRGSSALLGLEAARFIDPRATLDGVTVHLPGRLTRHVGAEGRRWLVDAAVDAVGVAEAVAQAGDVDFAFVSLPDGKDIAATAAWLDAHLQRRWLPVKPVAADHLAYASWDRPVIAWNETVARDCRNLVAVGSWSFIAEVLAMLGVETEVSFEVRQPRSGGRI
jgi:folylpolyglutamate synthase/dihydropteroate synthase